MLLPLLLLPVPYACCFFYSKAFLYTQVINVWLSWLYWQQGRATQRNRLRIDCSPETGLRFREDTLAYFVPHPQINSLLCSLVQKLQQSEKGGAREIKSLLTMKKDDPVWKPCKYGFSRARMHRVQLSHNNTYQKNKNKENSKHKPAQKKKRWSSLIFMSHYVFEKYYLKKKQPGQEALGEKNAQPLKIR